MCSSGGANACAGATGDVTKDVRVAMEVALESTSSLALTQVTSECPTESHSL